MKLRATSVDLFVTECQTRVPFRFGAVTMERAPLLTARVTIETARGTRVNGFSADLLVPKWFHKTAEQTPEEDAAELIDAARTAARTLCALGPASAFDLWWQAYEQLILSQPDDADDLLVRGFGLALCERAMLDAVCRAADTSFFAALKFDLFGFRPGDVHPELAAWNLPESLPERPLRFVRVRHTVGLADPLRATDIAAGARVDDGLPQALEEDIDRYGLSLFKVKIGRGHEPDRERLLDLARFFEARGADVQLTLDGNEQFEDLEQLAELFGKVAAEPSGKRLLSRLLFIEQPLHRRATFDPARNAAMDQVEQFAPVIIDEADTSSSAFPKAVALGYRGISVKNCKGVFRALVNRGLCDVSGDDLFQSAEDLTNLPVLALQQDLATIAALGLPHAERNGHHYFAGLAHLPQQEAQDALAAHPDLYEVRESVPALRIERGRLEFGSIHKPGFGYDVGIRVEERTPIP